MAFRDNMIAVLLDIFGRPESSIRNIVSSKQADAWKPVSPLEAEAFSRLVALENRQSLREWFLSLSGSNEMTETMRYLLEKEIGEPLPSEDGLSKRKGGKAGNGSKPSI